METTYRLLLDLLGRALFNKEVVLPEQVDWRALYKEARSQTVHLLVYDCLTSQEHSSMDPPVASLWQKAALSSLWKNEQLFHEQQRILTFFSQENISCLILKGSSSAMCYPKPEVRCAGDIDLLLSPEDLNRAIDLLISMGYGQPINFEHPVHRTMLHGDFCVELHFRMPCIPTTPIGAELEAYFQGVLEQTIHWGSLPVLPPTHQALLLLLHKLQHITTSGMGLRQLCDWAVFVHGQLTPALWETLKPTLQRFGLLRFTNVITRICVDFLALPAEAAPWCMQEDAGLCLQLLEDILRTGNFGHKENRYGQRLFTNPQSKNRLLSFWHTGVETCFLHWPVCKKHPVLLSIAPVVLLLRYRKQRKANQRPEFQPIRLYQEAKSRQALYQSLQVFLPEAE